MEKYLVGFANRLVQRMVIRAVLGLGVLAVLVSMHLINGPGAVDNGAGVANATSDAADSAATTHSHNPWALDASSTAAH